MIRIVSLASGIGGLDYGFHNKPGFNILTAVDFDKDACATYEANFPDTIVQCCSINDAIIPPHDMLLAGFPCQAFSINGKRLGFDDPRGKVFFDVMKVIEDHQPSFFILENVKGLLNHDKGRSLQVVLDEMHKHGYKVEYKLLKCEDLGIPQTRHRVIFFGVRNDIDIHPGDFFTYLSNIHVRTETLREVLTHVKEKFSLDERNHNLHTATEAKQHWMKILREGENLIRIDEQEIRKREAELNLPHRKIPNTQQGYIRLNSKKISPTMAFGNTCLPIHPFEDRSISVREGLTIQTFPDTFIVTGGIAAQYKQVGNAVPAKLSELFFDSFIKL